ncbi:MAG: hypothetical protein NC212_08485 [Staphylococcus sp.]|nr:hypothetical protein [Staphylococcus sp.]
MVTEKTIDIGHMASVSSPGGSEKFVTDKGVITLDALLALVKNSLQIGGRNLLLNSGAPISRITGNEARWTSEPLDQNKGYTLSFEADWDGETRPTSVEVFLGEKLGTAIVERNMVESKAVVKGRNVFYFDKLVKPHKMLGVWLGSANSVMFTVSNMKLEEGNVATAWCPAFEDYQSISGGVIHWSTMSCKASKLPYPRHRRRNIIAERHLFTL